MNELAFAKQFLTALDSRPIKLPSDHVADPRGFPAQGAYTLPKTPNQSAKRKRESRSTVPGAERSGSTINVALKNLKSPSSSLQLDNQPPTTSIYDFKSAYAANFGGDVAKIKLLYNKKPTTDSKTLKDLLGDAADTTKDVEFSVMVMGGGAPGKVASSPAASPAIEIPQPELPVAQGPSGAELLQSAAFWDDLKGFLQQRLKDEGEAARLASLFKSSWEKNS